MTETLARKCQAWALACLLVTGCASHAAPPHYTSPTVGAPCYAKAVPTVGTGGLAWGDTLSAARQKSLTNCVRYAARSGGTPETCRVVLAECKD